MDFQGLPDEVKVAICQYLVSSAGISSSWKLRGVCKLFREEIEREILQNQPQSAFFSAAHSLPDEEDQPLISSQTPGSYTLILHLTPRFLQAKVANSGSFDPSLPNAIMHMFNYMAQPLDSTDRYGLPRSNNTYESKEIVAQICQSICCMLGNDTVLNALFIDVSTSNLIKRPNESWLRVLNGSFDIHFKITAAIAVDCASRVRSLVQELLPDSLKHEVFGSPLLNAIKLGNLRILKKLIKYLQSSQITEAHRDTLFNNPLANFCIYKAIGKSITYSRDDMFLMVTKLIRRKFGGLKPRDFDAFVRLVVKTSNVRMLRYLFRIPTSPAWVLTQNTMCAICNSAEYDLIYFVFRKADCANAHRTSRRHPLHIAVRAGLEATRAVYDTGKYDVNESVSWPYKGYWDEPVTALDVAIFRHDHAIVKWLLDHGANYRRRFPSFYMSCRIFNYIRDRAIVDDPRMVDLPSYGQYSDMCREARDSFVFGLGQ